MNSLPEPVRRESAALAWTNCCAGTAGQPDRDYRSGRGAGKAPGRLPDPAAGFLPAAAGCWISAPGRGFPGLPLQNGLSGNCRSFRWMRCKKRSLSNAMWCGCLGLNGFRPGMAGPRSCRTGPRRPAASTVIVSRAFASLELFARLALPCLAPEGRIVAMKGAEGEAELAAAQEPLARLGLQVAGCRKIILPVSGARRTILTWYAPEYKIWWGASTSPQNLPLPIKYDVRTLFALPRRGFVLTLCPVAGT